MLVGKASHFAYRTMRRFGVSSQRLDEYSGKQFAQSHAMNPQNHNSLSYYSYWQMVSGCDWNDADRFLAGYENFVQYVESEDFNLKDPFFKEANHIIDTAESLGLQDGDSSAASWALTIRFYARMMDLKKEKTKKLSATDNNPIQHQNVNQFNEHIKM